MHDPLVGYAYGLTRDRAVALDLVQEAFVKVWEVREQLDPARSLRSLLYQTVRNRGLNHARDHQNRLELLADRYAPDHPVTPDVELDGSQLGHRLEGWIQELPDRQQEALRLSRFQGLAHDEIAEAMDISPRTVNNHLVRALRHLRERISAYAPHLLHEFS